MNALAVSADGESFVCAGSDRLVKCVGRGKRGRKRTRTLLCADSCVHMHI